MSGRLTNIRPKPGFLMDGSGEIVPARRGNVVSLFARDGLANIVSGRGTSVDRRTHNAWNMITMPPQQAEAAYRTNWLARKIVDIPAKDMTREGRAWQTDKAKIEKLEAEEKRLQLWPKLLRCLILARLFGGAALIPSTGDMDLDQPLAPDIVKKGGLQFVHVVNRWQLNIGPEITDPLSEWYGRPEWFEITGKNGASHARLHPSRVFDFVGQKVPEGTQFTAGDSWYWGDSILQAIDEAVKDATAAANGFAALTDIAAVSIYKIPELLDSVGTQEYEDRLMNMLGLTHRGRSTHRAELIDKDMDWEQRQMLWAGIPEVMMAFMELVAGAADIPVTRLLGQSPKGLQSTGKGEQQDYHDKVMADQNEILRPQLERFDELLIRSALGSKPSDIYFEFNSLEQPDETADAEIEKKVADTIKIYADTGLINEDVLGKMARNRIIEGGRWPGSEAAFEESDNEGLADPDEDPDAGKTQAQLAAEKVEAMRMAGTVDNAQAVALITDARPRSLYVSRKLLNVAEFLKWAKGQGFGETLSAADLHVTVLYSKTPVDWLKMGAAWGEDEQGRLTIQPGGARIVEPLGDKGAAVLLFASSQLAYRHEEMVRAGASHDFDSYQSHVTITWAAPDGLNLGDVEPYRGKLVFGPEIFAEIDEDWTPPGSKNNLADYDPDQPRDPGGEEGGQWISSGGAGGETKGRYEGKLPAGDKRTEMAKRALEVDKSFVAEKELTAAERNALGLYASSEYDEINGALRSGQGKKSEIADIRRAILNLDAAIAKERVTKDLLVYRGVHTSGTLADDLPVGALISDKGFVSTSADSGIAARFASWSDENNSDNTVVLRIKVPTGANALHVHPGRTWLSPEQEVLLPRGKSMRVLSGVKTETFTVYGKPRKTRVVDVELVQ